MTDTLYSKDIKGVKFRDTVVFRLPLKPEKSIGINDFRISVDLPISIINEQLMISTIMKFIKAPLFQPIH